jgi:hypothetical protein
LWPPVPDPAPLHLVAGHPDGTGDDLDRDRAGPSRGFPDPFPDLFPDFFPGVVADGHRPSW